MFLSRNWNWEEQFYPADEIKGSFRNPSHLKKVGERREYDSKDGDKSQNNVNSLNIRLPVCNGSQHFIYVSSRLLKRDFFFLYWREIHIYVIVYGDIVVARCFLKISVVIVLCCMQCYTRFAWGLKSTLGGETRHVLSPWHPVVEEREKEKEEIEREWDLFFLTYCFK